MRLSPPRTRRALRSACADCTCVPARARGTRAQLAVASAGCSSALVDLDDVQRRHPHHLGYPPHPHPRRPTPLPQAAIPFVTRPSARFWRMSGPRGAGRGSTHPRKPASAATTGTAQRDTQASSTRHHKIRCHRKRIMGSAERRQGMAQQGDARLGCPVPGPCLHWLCLWSDLPPAHRLVRPRPAVAPVELLKKCAESVPRMVPKNEAEQARAGSNGHAQRAQTGRAPAPC